jgi:hypothetical protein
LEERGLRAAYRDFRAPDATRSRLVAFFSSSDRRLAASWSLGGENGLLGGELPLGSVLLGGLLGRACIIVGRSPP